MSDYIERKSIRNMYSCLNPNDRVRAEQVVTDIDAIPSADAVSLEEFEQMRFLADKSMEMVGEPTWTDVLIELHSRFDALEKELRKASAEMSVIIREYVDKQTEPQTVTDKDLKEVRRAVARAKAFKPNDIDEPLTKCDLCKREGDDVCIDCERKGVGSEI